MKNLLITLTTLSCLSKAIATWQYLSRPDLAIPKLDITINEKGQAPGYLFVAPFTGSPVEDEYHPPLQPSAYILRSDGDLIFSAFANYLPGWVSNFQKADERHLLALSGKHSASRGHGHQLISILDNHYNVVATVKGGHHKLIDKHEGQLFEDGSTIFQIYHPVPRDLSGYDGGDSQRQWIIDSQFQDVDVNTGEVKFEWKSLDHVPPSHSNITLISGQSGSGFNSSKGWDYFHINSVDKNNEGDYLISARDTSSIYKISGKTGDIIYTLGGRNSNDDFKHLDKASHFSYQHHARFQGKDENSREIISLYDNSGHGTETSTGNEVIDAPTSSGKILLVDSVNFTVKTLHAYYPPDNLLSKSQGSTHVLENGNVLVNWGSEGAITEYKKDGKAIYHAYFEKEAQNYRAFKNEWKGYPIEEPAVVGYGYNKSQSTLSLIVAASWNGDTEVDVWKFYGSRTINSELEYIGQNKRRGFETKLELNDHGSKFVEVVAEGVDKYGKILTRTAREKVVNNAPLPPYYRNNSNNNNNSNIIHDSLNRFVIANEIFVNV